MLKCPIKTLPEWQRLEETFGASAAMSAFVLNGSEIPSVENARDLLESIKSPDVIFDLKVVNSLVELSSPKKTKFSEKYNLETKPERLTIRLNTAQNPYIEQNLRKNLAGKGVPSNQIDFIFDYMKSNNIKQIKSDDLAAQIAANYSYTIEINTATEKTENIKQIQATTFEVDGIDYIEAFGSWFKNEGTEKISYKEYKSALDKYNAKNIEKKPTQHYYNLSVPGGTNYTENEIATPAITPSIKGHAQFATDKGIGWFRSDDKTVDELKGNWIKSESELPNEFIFSGERYFKKGGEWQTKNNFIEDIETVIWRYNMSLGNKRIQNKPQDKIRRILEVQSDLFQKGRENLMLTETLKKGYKFTTDKGTFEVTEANYSYIQYKKVGEEKEYTINTNKFQELIKEKIGKDISPLNSNENQFLQLLNKNNNWVTFFVKSIMQDSAKKGYEKVLFPSGDTASKVEGHSTLEEFKKQKEDRIRELEEAKQDIEKLKVNSYEIAGVTINEPAYVFQGTIIQNKNAFEKEINGKIDKEITQLKQELKRVETEGFGALKPIYNFYENTVTNILKKQGYNPKLITDEYGNTWSQVEINLEKDLSKILLQKENKNIKPGVEELFDSNPELANIGTREQYSQYLDTVFPDSKVKDIVYHGSPSKHEVFKTTDSKAREERFKHTGAIFTSDKKYTYAFGENLYNVILNIKNPVLLPENTGINSTYIATQYFSKWKKENKDSVIGHDAWLDLNHISDGTEYAVFNPEQIHILGSKNDIESFKEFTNNVSKEKNNPINDKILELFNSDVYGNIREFESSEVQQYLDANETNLKAVENNGVVNILENGQKIQPSLNRKDPAEYNKRFQSAKKILDNLSERFNISYEFSTEIGAKGAFNTKDNKVYINPDKFSTDTLFHEFAHPFILALKKSNVKLYNQLIKEASTNYNLIESKKRLYPEASNEALMEEVLVEMIGLAAANKLENKKQKNLVNRFLDWVNSLLNEFLGLNKKISLNSSINDIADFFANKKDTMDLNLNYSEETELENLLQATEDEIAELEQAIEEDSIKSDQIDEWYLNIQKYIRDSIKKGESIINTKKSDVKDTKRGKKASERLKELKAIKDLINANQKVASVAHFVSEYYDEINQRREEFFTDIEPKIKEIENMSQEELGAFLEKLSFYNMFSQSNAVLKEIANDTYLNLFSSKYKSETGKSSLVDKANAASRMLDNMNASTIQIAKKVLTYHTIKPMMEDSGVDISKLEEELNPRIARKEAEIKSLKEKIAESRAKNKNTTQAEKKLAKLNESLSELKKTKDFQIFTPESIIKAMSFSGKDISFLGRHTLPMASYKDPIAALFTLKLKEKLMEARDKTMTMENRIGQMYEKLAKKYGKNLTTISEFEDFIEEVEVPIYGFSEDGSRTIIGTNKVKQLVSEIDTGKYYASMKKAFSEADNKFGKTKSKEKSKFMSNWFRENTEPKSPEDIQELVNHQKRLLNDDIISPQEYEDWKNANMYVDANGNITYLRDLTQPKKSIYTNTKYKTLLLPQNSAKLEFFNEYKQIYSELQEMLPNNHRKGLQLPSVHKGFKSKVIEDGLMKAGVDYFKDFSKYQAQDQQYGVSTINGEAVREIPVFLTQNMPADNVSSDLIGSLMLFTHMANEYAVKEEMHAEVNMMEQVMINRQYGKTNSLGTPILNENGEQQLKSSRENKEITEEFLNMIDKNFYGVRKLKTELGGFAVDKIVDSIAGNQALAALGGFRPLKQMANNLQANFMVLTEAAAGKYLDKASLAKGKVDYGLAYMAMVKDIMSPKLTGKSIETQLIEKFDVIKGDYVNNLGEVVTGNLSKKIANQGLMFFSQKMSEHEAQVSAFFGMLRFTKVKDPNGKEVELKEAFELDENGVLRVKAGYDFDAKKINNFRNKVSALSDRLYGVYNEFDKTSAQRNAFVRSVFMFRKFLAPGFERRYKAASYDYQLGDITEGMYRSYLNSVVDAFKDNVYEGLSTIIKNNASMTPLQKENSKRTRAELMLIAVFTILAGSLSKYIDDDDEFKSMEDGLQKRSIYGFEYLSTRLLTELKTYSPPYNDLMRVISTPSVNASYVERFFKLINQAFSDPGERYKKRQGIWEKGDLKILARLSAMFGITGNEIHPQYATQNLKRFL